MGPIRMGVIFEFYAVDEPVDAVRAFDPDTLRDAAEQIGDISINSRAMGDLVDWMLATPLAHLVQDPDGAPAALLVPRSVVDAVAEAYVSPEDDPEDVAAAFVDVLRSAVEEADWKGRGLAIAVA